LKKTKPISNKIADKFEDEKTRMMLKDEKKQKSILKEVNKILKGKKI